MTSTSVEFPHAEVVSFLRAEIFAALRPYGYEHPAKDAPIRYQRLGIDVDVHDDVVYVGVPDEAAADEVRRLTGDITRDSIGATIAAIVLAVHAQENRRQAGRPPRP